MRHFLFPSGDYLVTDIELDSVPKNAVEGTIAVPERPSESHEYDREAGAWVFSEELDAQNAADIKASALLNLKMEKEAHISSFASFETRNLILALAVRGFTDVADIIAFDDYTDFLNRTNAEVQNALNSGSEPVFETPNQEVLNLFAKYEA